MTALSEALADRETVRERLPLRTGGTVALTDDHLLVAADDGVTRVARDDVTGVTVEDFDYLLGVLSAALVVWGLYDVPRNTALGLAFVAFGAFGFLWTYRKRGKARIEVLDRPKPISVFPEDTAAFLNAVEPLTATEPGDSAE